MVYLDTGISSTFKVANIMGELNGGGSMEKAAVQEADLDAARVVVSPLKPSGWR
jgi:hypothetical protein